MYFRNQSRSDRDSYVKIIWSNIPEDKKYNFQKYSETVVNHFNLSYDFEVRYGNKIPKKEYEHMMVFKICYLNGILMKSDIVWNPQSSMHYGSFEFSKNGGRTIQTLDQAKEDLLGQDNRPYYNRGVCLNLIKKGILQT